MNELINDEAVYRTALATPGLLIISNRGYQEDGSNQTDPNRRVQMDGFQSTGPSRQVQIDGPK